jgi:dipeptidyl aminopeptidase/acylaminoacyl peptidase
MKISKVEPPREGAFTYLTDRRGNVRLTMSEGDDKRGLLTGISRIEYRAKNSREWRELGTFNERSREGWWPLSIDSDADALFALKKVDGRMALYRVALDGSGTSTLVGQHPQVDVDEVVTLGPGQKIIGYTFADERRQTVYFDPEYARLQAGLARALPNQPLISFHGATADGQKVLVLASGDTSAGTFYRYDKATKQLAEVAQVRPETAGRQLAPMKAITFSASDGTKIPAYLTIPVGSDGKKLPTVVLPHGGPSARDEWGFDWLAQFLAARGYAVIQPNFRGSDGYGDAWLAQNGFKGWRTSIGDVTAAAKYLVAQGIADPNKLAIVGWSYGGYAALQSAVVEPKLYKAAVAIAPVTDLAMVTKEAQGFTSEQLVRDFVGTGPHLVEGSPLRNVKAIQIPVLLVHGDRDANVAVAQSVRMQAALVGAGQKSELLRFDNLDHQLDDSDARIRMLTKIGEFLQASIGQ